MIEKDPFNIYWWNLMDIVITWKAFGRISGQKLIKFMPDSVCPSFPNTLYINVVVGQQLGNINARVAFREIGPTLGFYGNFSKAPVANFSDFRINRIYFWGKQHPNLKSLQLSCFAFLTLWLYVMGPGGQSWNVRQTKWEQFGLPLVGFYFYIWFVFYASLPN